MDFSGNQERVIFIEKPGVAAETDLEKGLLRSLSRTLMKRLSREQRTRRPLKS